MKKEVKLSKTQEGVLLWLAGGWTATQSVGASVTICGERVCNLDTMIVLERHGFAERLDSYRWVATKAGREFMANKRRSQ